MIPQSKADAVSQASVYVITVIATGVSVAADNPYLAWITGASAIVLVWSNILINRAKRRKIEAEIELLRVKAVRFK